jgi:hypothetical protein
MDECQLCSLVCGVVKWSADMNFLIGWWRYIDDKYEMLCRNMRILILEINSGSRLHSIAATNTLNYMWAEVYRNTRLYVIIWGVFLGTARLQNATQYGSCHIQQNYSTVWCMYVCICVCVCMYVCMRMCVCVYVCMYVFMYVRTYVCV